MHNLQWYLVKRIPPLVLSHSRTKAIMAQIARSAWQWFDNVQKETIRLGSVSIWKSIFSETHRNTISRPPPKLRCLIHILLQLCCQLWKVQEEMLCFSQYRCRPCDFASRIDQLYRIKHRAAIVTLISLGILQSYVHWDQSWYLIVHRNCCQLITKNFEARQISFKLRAQTWVAIFFFGFQMWILAHLRLLQSRVTFLT